MHIIAINTLCLVHTVHCMIRTQSVFVAVGGNVL